MVWYGMVCDMDRLYSTNMGADKGWNAALPSSVVAWLVESTASSTEQYNRYSISVG
jgi:hypothetical protein